jgi:hypothetical protein
MNSGLAERLDYLYNSGDFDGLKANVALIDSDDHHPKFLRYRGFIKIFDNEADGMILLESSSALGDNLARRIVQCIRELKLSRESHLTFELLKSAVDLNLLRGSVYLEYPTEISIETQAVCNAACTFCPYPTMERKGQKMTDDLLDKIISDLHEIPRDVKFGIAPFKVSDPFLDKRIFDFSKRINNELPNADLRFFTNGAPLTDKNIEKLREIKNISHLWISLNDSDPDRYERLMGIPFGKTIERMDSLHRTVKDGYPHQVCVSRVQDYTSGDNDFLDFVKNRYPLFRAMVTKRSNWVGQVSTEIDETVPPLACGRWFELSIMATGKVALCCMDGDGKHIIGDVSSQSVLEIYNTPEYKKMRQFLSSRKGAASPCDTCNL